jgi:hypothetical protein
MEEALSDGDLVVVRTARGEGQFICRLDGSHLYLQEVDRGTVKRITGYGGCVLPARPATGVTVEKVKEKSNGRK